MMRIENGEVKNYNRSKLNRRIRPDDEEQNEYEPRGLRFNPHLIRKAIPTIHNQGARIFPERKNWRARGGDAASDWAAFTNEFTNPDSLLNQTDDKIRDLFKQIENDLGDVFDPNKNGVRELFENFRNEVGPLIGQMGDQLKYDLDPELNGVNQAFRDAKGDIDKAFENIGEKMWNFYRDYIFPFPLASALGRAWKPLGDLFHNLTDKDWWEDKLSDPETYFWVAQTILTVASVWLGPMTTAIAAGTIAAMRLITKASLGQEVYASEILDIGVCLLPQGRLMRPARPGGGQLMSFGDVVMDTVKTLVKNQRGKDPNARFRSMGQGLCAAVACGEDYEIIPPVNRKGFIQTAIQNSNKNIERSWNLEHRGEYIKRYNVYVQDRVNMGKKNVTTKVNGKDVTKEQDDIRAIESFTKYQIELDDFKDRDKIPKVLLAEEVALKQMEMWKHNKKVWQENKDFETEDLTLDIPLNVVSGIDFKTGEAFYMERPIKPAQSAGAKVGNIFLMKQKVEYREGEFAAKCLDGNYLPPKASETAWQSDPKARVFECMKDIPLGTSTFVNPAPKAGETFESVYNAKGGYWRECTLDYANNQPGATTYTDPRDQYIADCKRFRELYYIMKNNESYAVDLARDRTIIQDRLKKEFPVRVANTAQAWLTAIIKNEVESYSRAIKGESTVYNYKTNPKLKEENTQYMFKYYTDYWTNYYHGPNYFLSVEEAKAYYAVHPDKYPGNPIYERDYSKGTSGQYFTGKEWLGYDPDMLSTQKRIDAAREGKLGKRLDLSTLELRKEVQTANEYGFDLEGNDLSELVMVNPGQPPYNPDDYGLDFHKQVELHMYRFFTCDFNEKNKHASKTDKGDSLTCLFNTTTTQFPNPDNPSEMLSFSKVVDAIEKELNKNYEYDDDRIKEEKYDDSEAYFQSVLGMSRDEKLAYFRSLFDTAEMILKAYSIKYPTTLLHDSPIWNKSTKRIEIPALSPQQLLDLGLGTKVNEQLHYNSIQGYNQEEFIARDVRAKRYENNWIGRKEFEEDLAFRVEYGRHMSAADTEAFEKEWKAELDRVHDYDEGINTHNILVPLEKGTEAVSFPWQIAPPDQVIIGKNDDATFDALKSKYQEGLKLSKTTKQMSTEKVAIEKREKGKAMMQEVKDYIEGLFAYLYPYHQAWLDDYNPGYNGTINLNQVYRVFKGSQKGSLNPKTTIQEFSEDYFLKHFMDEEMAKPRPPMKKIGHVDRVIEPWNSYKSIKETDKPYTRKDVEKKALESIKKAAVMLAAQNPNFYEVYTTNGMTDVIKYYKTIMDINDIEEEQRLAIEYPKNVATWDGKLREFIENFVRSEISKLDAIPEFITIQTTEKDNVEVTPGVWKVLKSNVTKKLKNPDWIGVNRVTVPERKDLLRKVANAALSILNDTGTIYFSPVTTETTSIIKRNNEYMEFADKYPHYGFWLFTSIAKYLDQNPKPNAPPPHLEPEDDDTLYKHAMEKYQMEMASWVQAREDLVRLKLIEGVDPSEDSIEKQRKQFEEKLPKPIFSLPKSYKKGEDFEQQLSETQKEDEITLANYTKELERYTRKKDAFIQEYLNRVPPEQRPQGYRNEQELGDVYEAQSTIDAGTIFEDISKPQKPIPPILQSESLSPVFRSSDPKRDAYLQKTQKTYLTNKKIREGYETQSEEDIQWFADREEYQLKLKHDLEDMKAEQKADLNRSKVPKEALARLEKTNLEIKLQQEENERKLQQQRELESIQKKERDALLEAERKKMEEAGALHEQQVQKAEAERAAKVTSDQETFRKNYQQELLKPSFPRTFVAGIYDRSVVINGVFTPQYPVKVKGMGPNDPAPQSNYISPTDPVKEENVFSKPGEAYHPKPINLQYAKEVQLMEEQVVEDEEAKKQNPDLEDENIDPYDELLVEGLDQRTLDSIPSFKLIHPNASRAYIRMAYGLEPPSPEFLSGAMGAGKSRNYKRRKLNRL